MKKQPSPQKTIQQKVPIRTLLKREGKMVHGTRGKPNRGPRGNKH